MRVQVNVLVFKHLQHLENVNKRKAMRKSVLLTFLFCITIYKIALVHKIHKIRFKPVIKYNLLYYKAPSKQWRGTLTQIGSFMWAGLYLVRHS